MEPVGQVGPARQEVVSYRSMNMMDEYVLMERVKEQLCYVARRACTQQPLGHQG